MADSQRKFERYAIVGSTDIADVVKKLQQSGRLDAKFEKKSDQLINRIFDHDKILA